MGLKLAPESWLDVSPLWFLSLDASYGAAFQQYWCLARVGYRLGPRLASGWKLARSAMRNTTLRAAEAS